MLLVFLLKNSRTFVVEFILGFYEQAFNPNHFYFYMYKQLCTNEY